MRVIAATFAQEARAADALSELVTLGLPLDVGIAPAVGGPSWTPVTCLAGHFRDEDAARVVAVIERHGGEMMANVDEAWTRPPASRPSLER